MKRLSFVLAGTLLASLACAPSARAATNLYGDHIDVSWALPNQNSPFAGFTVEGGGSHGAFYVGSGVEARASISTIKGIVIDFTKNALNITFENAAVLASYPFSGMVFRQLDGDTFSQITSLSGLASNRVTNDGNKLFVNLSGLKPTAGQTYSIQFNSAVPEPATWAMMLGGFGIVGGALRRRRRQSPALTYA